jgi:putative solute:sodium symporter small subunit
MLATGGSFSLPQSDLEESDMGGAGRLVDALAAPFAESMQSAQAAAGRRTRLMPQPQPSQANTDAHWKATTRLMFTHLGIWLFFGYIIHMFVVPLNKIVIPVLGFPLGFYMAAQGSLIVFVVMLFVFAKQQNKIDREYGMAEED